MDINVTTFRAIFLGLLTTGFVSSLPAFADTHIGPDANTHAPFSDGHDFECIAPQFNLWDLDSGGEGRSTYDNDFDANFNFDCQEGEADMAEEDNDTREPDATEEAGTASAGGQEVASPGLVSEDTPLPDFVEMNNNIKETRKPAGPEFDDPEPGAASILADDDEEDFGPTDPS